MRKKSNPLQIQLCLLGLREWIHSRTKILIFQVLYLITCKDKIIINMFNPKQRLEQLRKNKTVKEQVTTFLAENNNPVPLFQQPKPPQDSNSQLMARMARLQNTVNELSGQLKNSNETVQSLKKEKSALQTKLLRLQYQNSQLKVSSRTANEEIGERVQYNNSRPLLRDSSDVKKTQSQIISDEPLMPEVEEALEQVKKEPIQNILKKMQQNFRALKADPKQISTGNKNLRDFAAICKEYNKTLKKPVLILKLNSNDFD